MLFPVVGVKLTGPLAGGASATDLVVTIMICGASTESVVSLWNIWGRGAGASARGIGRRLRIGPPIM